VLRAEEGAAGGEIAGVCPEWVRQFHLFGMRAAERPIHKSPAPLRGQNGQPGLLRVRKIGGLALLER